MMCEEKISFEEIYEQNKKRIHYQMNRLRIRSKLEDISLIEDFYQEGLFALWNAYEKYDPDRGTLSTYFNYAIRNRLIDMLRKKTRDHRNDGMYFQEERVKIDQGNRYVRNRQVIPDTSKIPIKDVSLWLQVKSLLTEKQWTWVECFIILDMSIKDIAGQEAVSTDAVKSWGREVRKKLKEDEFKKIMKEYSVD